MFTEFFEFGVGGGRFRSNSECGPTNF